MINSMNRKLLTPLLLFSLYLSTGFANSLKMAGDSIPCILFFEISQNENDEYVVSLIPDTTWTFPRNIVSTAQITVKVPTGVFEVGEPVDLIEGVTFFKSGRDNNPIEDPQSDYVSFSLGTQGTTRIPFEKGQKVDLFSFSNTGTCPNGLVSLMNNFNDPFYPPNSKQSNAGQQMTVSGFGAPDLPVGIRGNGVSCNPDNPTPVDTMVTTPVDTMVTTPVDTMETTPDGTPPFIDSDLTVQIATQAISCNGANDGIIVLKVDNGQAPYSYSWNTGATTSGIENLSPGTYSVTIQDATGFMILRTLTIVESEPLEVMVAQSNTTMTGANDGSARAIVVGGTTPYSYLWNTGAIGSTINNLTEGNYSLTATDAHGCTSIQSFNIIDPAQCPQIDVALDMKTPSCTGGNDGQILATPLNGTAPFTFVWEIGNETNFVTNIPSGNYMVTLTDGAGCTTAVSATLPDATPLSVTLTTSNDQISTTVTGGAPPYVYNWSNGASSTSITNLEGGVYGLTITDNLGCMQTTSAVITNTNTGTDNSCGLNILDSFGSSILLDEIACEEKGTLCLPVPFDSMAQYSIFLDGDDYSSNLAGCQFETYFAYSYAFFPAGNTMGTYNLREWTINGNSFSGVFNSIDDLVANMNTWDPNGNWVNLKNISIIQGGNASNTYGTMVLVSGAASTILDVNSNLTPTGTEITFKPGTHQLILIKNATSCSDTLAIELPCSDAVTSRDTTINLTVNEGEGSSLCLIPIFGSSIAVSPNSCPTLSGTSAEVTFDFGGNCVNIQGLMTGTNEACYTITTTNGETINVTIIITVVSSTLPCIEFTQDSIYAFAPSCNPMEVCLNIPFSVLSNATIVANNEPYTGGVMPCSNGESQLSFTVPGAYNLAITYGTNCSISLVLIIGCDSDEVIEQTIEVGTSEVVCINLPGILGIFNTVENICPEKGNMEVLFQTLENSGCISYTGIGIGSDTACIKVCDFFGFCDTVTLIFHVEDPTGTPPTLFDAVNDTATIQLNSSIVLDILGNDVFRSIDTLYKVSEPNFGEAFINPDATLTYISQTGYCDDDLPDTFRYSICEGGICDTATVAITVNCFVNRTLTVYTGVSPNGDGINDSFLIEGIENYPNNSVSVFNRWGNMVFHQDGYKNEWKATWNDRKELPDGTYFYKVNLGDGSKPLKGFMQVRR